jgi:antirestriction protein ArdC
MGQLAIGAAVALAAQQRGHPMKLDLYAEVSKRIVSELEAGAPPWIKPWSATAGHNIPCNASAVRFSEGDFVK